MTGILNEALADRQVIKVLLNELRKCRKYHMGKLLVDIESGEIYISHQHELITDDDLDKNVAESKNNIDTIARVRKYAHDVAVATTPADQPPVASEAPAPAPVEQPQPAPLETPAPVAPATDQAPAPAIPQ